MAGPASSEKSDHGANHLISFELPAKLESGPGRIGVLEHVIEESAFERAAFAMSPGRPPQPSA